MLGEKNNHESIRWLTYIVLAYMMLAFIWWSYLLFVKNNDAFQAKTHLEYYQNYQDIPWEEFQETAYYRNIEEDYTRQEWMISGEAIAFVISLFLGIYFINRSHRKEMELVEEKRNFLLSITHELKSPLASIRLVLQTFIKRELDRDKVVKLAYSGIDETNRLSELVNDLLLAARVESNFIVKKTASNLVELMLVAEERCLRKYDNAVIRIHEPREDFPHIMLDYGNIISVFTNLFENAVKYAIDLPEIDVYFEWKEKDNKVVIEVADNGIGIADKNKNLVFRRFYRVGNEDTRKTKGTGLGLYIVKKIIDAHDGTIRIVDNKPNGTRFVIELPNE